MRRRDNRVFSPVWIEAVPETTDETQEDYLSVMCDAYAV